MTPSKTLFYLCISFVIGIFLSSIIKIPQIILWGFLILGILIIIISLVMFNNRRTSIIEHYQNNILVLGFCILFLVLGIIRLQISEFNILKDQLRSFNDRPENITLIGEVSSGPDIRDNSQKLKVKINNMQSTVLVTVGRYPEYKYLDDIKITGKLKTPAMFDGFNYKDYLLKDGIYSVMDFPKTELVPERNHYNVFTFLYEQILFLKEKLRESIYINFSPPQSFILQGTILGDNGAMSQDLKNELNITGLRHIIAVSGTHIVILSSILMAFLLLLGFWRGQAFYFSIIFIWFYIILIGFPASGVRAVIMGSIFLLAQKLGRQNTSSRIIIFSACLMLLQNPFLLFYDVGFQLSFLASMGIIYLEPIISNLFRTFSNISLPAGREILLSEKTKNNLLSIISTTFAAQIFTLPIIVYNFGSMSIISPITNLLVLPVIYWLMVFGFLSSILGIFSNILGFIFSIPCWFLLTYFVKVIDIFSQPWASKTIENVSWVWLSVYYFVVVIIIKFLQKFQKPKFLGY